jgi:hypothetical protein
MGELMNMLFGEDPKKKRYNQIDSAVRNATGAGNAGALPTPAPTPQPPAPTEPTIPKETVDAGIAELLEKQRKKKEEEAAKEAAKVRTITPTGY